MSKPVKKLLFKNPVHNKKLNMTVRRGVQWNLEKYADVEGLGVRKITTQVMRFQDLRNFHLEHEHDPVCRNVIDLYGEMTEIYSNFQAQEIVTLVYYGG